MREYSAYQQTESYKQFMKSKYSGRTTACDVYWKTLFVASNQILTCVLQGWAKVVAAGPKRSHKSRRKGHRKSPQNPRYGVPSQMWIILRKNNGWKWPPSSPILLPLSPSSSPSSLSPPLSSSLLVTHLLSRIPRSLSPHPASPRLYPLNKTLYQAQTYPSSLISFCSITEVRRSCVSHVTTKACCIQYLVGSNLMG